MVKKDYFKDIDDEQLLIKYKMSKLLFEYYNNETRANEGNYYETNKIAYEENKELMLKYNDIKRKIFIEIENRINELAKNL